VSTTAIGVILFVIALLTSVMLHEAGHFLTARAFGMKASQFFVGFGPTLWSFRRGETEYGVKAIPAGGFVKIIGMTHVEDIDPEDEPRAFWRQPAWQRFIVLVAGSTVHFILAFLIFIPAFALFDQPTGEVSTVVATVSECVPKTADAACAPGDPAPAKAAGLRAGDKVVELNGSPVASWEGFAVPLRRSTGPVQLVVERDGQRVPLTVAPARVTRPDPDDATRTVEVAQIGVSPEQEIKELGIGAAVAASARAIPDGIASSYKVMLKLPEGVWETIKVTIQGDDRELVDAWAAELGLTDWYQWVRAT